MTDRISEARRLVTTAAWPWGEILSALLGRIDELENALRYERDDHQETANLLHARTKRVDEVAAERDRFAAQRDALVELANGLLVLLHDRCPEGNQRLLDALREKDGDARARLSVPS